jgi:hypothetical protein
MINTKLAEKFTKLAKGMEKQIDTKMNPATAGQNLTRRRAMIIDSMRRDGERLKKVQDALLAVANAASEGNLPESLAKLSSRADIEMLLRLASYPSARWGEPVEWKPLAKLGVIDDDSFLKAKEDLTGILGRCEETPEERNLKELKKLEVELRLRKEAGFFVTPDEVVEKMLDYADIGPDDTILEPSAGIGNIADKLPKDRLKVIEWNSARNRLLQLKGYDVIGDDFLEHNERYDRILQNPPFELGQDIDHVRHAYECLNPGGVLVSIMSEGPFFRNDKKCVDFREWLDDVGGMSRKLGPDAFKKSGTGVSTRIVVIRKLDEDRRAA